LLIAALAGFLLNSATQFMVPNSALRVDFSGRAYQYHSVVSNLQLQLVRLLASPELIVALAVAFASLAIFKYRRPGAWVYAFLAGVSVTHTFFHLIFA
jgi:hypothetical protein